VLNAIKIIEIVDNKDIKNMDKFDYAKFLNLKGVILYENGYHSKALNYFNLASINFKEISQDPYDPFLINNKFDEILGTSFFCSNFNETKNEILELISMSQLLNNDYLIIKGFLTLSSFYCNVGNFRHGFGIVKYTLDLVKNKNFKSDFIMNRLIYLYVLCYAVQKKSFSKDEIFSKINNENNDLMKNQLKELKENLKLNKKISNFINENDDKNKESNEFKEFNLYQHPLHIAQVLYCYGDKLFKMREMYKGLFFIDKAIEHLEKNNYHDIHLVLYYVKKWVILSNMGREATAEHLIEHTQKLINKLYGYDSLMSLEYLRYLQINSSNVEPPRTDIINEIIKKTKRVNDVDNANSLVTKFFNILSLANARSGYPEIMEIYKEFDQLEKKIFDNKPTEMRADIKTNFVMLRLTAILRMDE